VIPEVRYGPWQGDRRKGPWARVRALHCSRCDAILARQTSVDEGDLDGDPSTLRPLWPHLTYCRIELILLPELASLSSPGLPVYGLASRARRGKSPRPIVRHQQVVELRFRELPIETPDDLERALPAIASGARDDSNTAARSVRRRVRLEPVAFDSLPGENGRYLPTIVGVPCEVFCVNCHGRHLLTGGGQEVAAV
jgi:hypothetical protein